MKKIIAFLLTAVILLSMTACGGGGNDTPPSNTDKPANTDTSAPTTTPGTNEKEDGGKAPAGENSIVMWYGANYYGVHETTFYCPEGAYIDEDDLEDYKENGSVSSSTFTMT